MGPVFWAVVVVLLAGWTGRIQAQSPSVPSVAPTSNPTNHSKNPTRLPTCAPSPSYAPSYAPSRPTRAPTTQQPTHSLKPSLPPDQTYQVCRYSVLEMPEYLAVVFTSPPICVTCSPRRSPRRSRQCDLAHVPRPIPHASPRRNHRHSPRSSQQRCPATNPANSPHVRCVAFSAS